MSVRERAEHLITLADAASEGPWWGNSYGEIFSKPRSDAWLDAENAIPDDAADDDPRWAEVTKLEDASHVAWAAKGVEAPANERFIAVARAEAPWVARQLLEALNRIEDASRWHYVTESADGEWNVCAACSDPWPCPTWLALNPKEADE